MGLEVVCEMGIVKSARMVAMRQASNLSPVNSSPVWEKRRGHSFHTGFALTPLPSRSLDLSFPPVPEPPAEAGFFACLPSYA